MPPAVTSQTNHLPSGVNTNKGEVVIITQQNVPPEMMNNLDYSYSLNQSSLFNDSKLVPMDHLGQTVSSPLYHERTQYYQPEQKPLNFQQSPLANPDIQNSLIG
mmetsp:Transcript_1836/g.1754  ORF Transcript_1836/g.1754 Transcript_1836/m.1754 type:complete len:104 (-) Transcript_1836:1468-1779(-)